MQLVHFIENKLEENYHKMKMSHKGNYGNNKKIQGNFTIFGDDFYFSIYEKK
ncbi:Uncharacterised protein [Campylobacter upsaliensis]|nr:Uncharacterised protein [Campylobacter upsaliensis]